MQTVWRWAVLPLFTLTLLGCATARIAEQRIVRGQVTDEMGRPVVGTPVLLVARTLRFNIPYYRDLGQQELKTKTDEEGRYRFAFTPEELGNNFFLFFYGNEGFDAVRYQQPEPLDITKQLRARREVIIDQVLKTHPQWEQVERFLQVYGPESDRGRVLRQMGLPEKREGGAGSERDVETWWYYSKGLNYRFVKGVLESTFQFEPIKPSR